MFQCHHVIFWFVLGGIMVGPFEAEHGGQQHLRKIQRLSLTEFRVVSIKVQSKTNYIQIILISDVFNHFICICFRLYNLQNCNRQPTRETRLFSSRPFGHLHLICSNHSTILHFHKFKISI